MWLVGWLFNFVAYTLFVFVSSYVLLLGIKNTGVKKDYVVFAVMVFIVLLLW